MLLLNISPRLLELANLLSNTIIFPRSTHDYRLYILTLIIYITHNHDHSPDT